MQALHDGANLMAVVSLQMAKVVKYLLNKGLLLNDRRNKALCWPLNMLSIVDLKYRLSLLFAWLVRLWFQSLHKVDRAYLTFHTNLLVLSACPSLFMLSILQLCSLVHVTASQLVSQSN